MPLPTIKKDETRDTFIQRCMNDEVMKKEYPDARQRIAVCAVQIKGVK